MLEFIHLVIIYKKHKKDDSWLLNDFYVLFSNIFKTLISKFWIKYQYYMVTHKHCVSS